MPRKLGLLADAGARAGRCRRRSAPAAAARVRSKLARSRSSLLMKTRRGQVELGGQLPGRLGLGLDTVDRAHHDDDAGRPPSGGAHLAEEVGVARGVDDVELHVAHHARGQGQRERHVALDLLGLEVAHRGAVVDPALAGDGAGGEEQGLGQRGLARPVVSDQGDVADAGRWVARHPAHLPSLDVRRRRPPMLGAPSLPAPHSMPGHGADLGPAAGRRPGRPGEVEGPERRRW